MQPSDAVKSVHRSTGRDARENMHKRERFRTLLAITILAAASGLAVFSLQTPAHASPQFCWAPDTFQAFDDENITGSGNYTVISPQGAGVHTYIGSIYLSFSSPSGRDFDIGGSSGNNPILYYGLATSQEAAQTINLFGYDIGANATVVVHLFTGTNAISVVGMATFSTTAPTGNACTTGMTFDGSGNLKVHDPTYPTFGVTVANTPGVAITSPSPIGGGGGGVAAGSCVGATPTATPTPGPTPTSSYVACAVNTSDPVDAGNLQDTVLVIGLTVIALLGGLLTAQLRRRS